MSISKDASETATANEHLWTAITDWVQAEGGHVHPALTLQGNGPSRGVYTTGEIPPGELLIRIPPKCVVSGANVSPEQKRNNTADSHPTKTASPWLRCLAAYYQATCTKNKKSEYDPYLKSLPNEYETLFQWTDVQVAQHLTGTSLGKLDRTQDSLSTRYRQAVRPYLEALNLLSTNESSHDKKKELRDFQHACMCISTRGFHLQQQGNDNETPQDDAPPLYHGPFLLPVIDLLNHDPPNKCTTLQRDAATEVFTMVAERSIAAKEQVVHSYGDSLTSAQILQTFGFVPNVHIQRALKSDLFNGKVDNNLTPAVLSKSKDLLVACRKITKSDYPSQLHAVVSTKHTEDEVWDVSNLPTRNVKEISEDLTLSSKPFLFSEELITLVCAQFLPEDAYQEVFGLEGTTLLDRSILEDYYLGNLVCRSVLTAIDDKLATYLLFGSVTDSDKGPPLHRDQESLRKLFQAKPNDLASYRKMYGLTIRIEEMASLEALRKEVEDVVGCLEHGRSIELLHHDDTDNHAEKRQKTE
jgi:hypothetical protein